MGHATLPPDQLGALRFPVGKPQEAPLVCAWEGGGDPGSLGAVAAQLESITASLSAGRSAHLIARGIGFTALKQPCHCEA